MLRCLPALLVLALCACDDGGSEVFAGTSRRDPRDGGGSSSSGVRPPSSSSSTSGSSPSAADAAADGAAPPGSSSSGSGPCDFAPNRVYLGGLLSGNTCVALAEPSTPSKVCGGFRVADSSGGIVRPTDGRLVYLAGTPATLRLLVPDEISDLSCPADPSGNDEEVSTPSCVTGVSAFRLDPQDGSLVYRCAAVPGGGLAPWVVENGESAAPDEPGDIEAVGYDGLKLAYSLGTGELVVFDATGMRVGALPLGVGPRGAFRATASGFLIAAENPDGDFQLWTALADGTVTLSGSYPPMEEGTMARSHALTADGTLFQVIEQIDATQVVRQDVEGGSEIIYTSLEPPLLAPYVQVPAGSLSTGP